jgi:hypothetical protein
MFGSCRLPGLGRQVDDDIHAGQRLDVGSRFRDFPPHELNAAVPGSGWKATRQASNAAEPTVGNRPEKMTTDETGTPGHEKRPHFGHEKHYRGRPIERRKTVFP